MEAFCGGPRVKGVVGTPQVAGTPGVVGFDLEHSLVGLVGLGNALVGLKKNKEVIAVVVVKQQCFLGLGAHEKVGLEEVKMLVD